MKYKALFVFFFGIILSLISIRNSFAGWPISYTPAIEGVITDATTGKPIENVVVSCVWYKTSMSIGDTVDQAFGSKIVVTKADGKFSFPSKTGFHVLSWFDSVMLQVNHPLYESKMNSFNKEDINHLKKGETQYNSGGARVIPAKYENGKIQYPIKLIYLESKYLKEIKEGTWSDNVIKGDWANVSQKEKDRVFDIVSSFEGKLEDEKNGWYWKVLEKNNIEYKLDEIFNIWEKIAMIFKDYFKSDSLEKATLETESYIRKEMNKKK